MDDDRIMGRDALGRFKAGEPSCLTQEEKLRRVQSMSEAWKTREDYIGDINDEFVAEYESENEAASLNNVSANSINAAVNGKARNGHKLINYLWYNERTIKNK